jgi:hypothetical protein
MDIEPEEMEMSNNKYFQHYLIWLVTVVALFFASGSISYFAIKQDALAQKVEWVVQRVQCTELVQDLVIQKLGIPKPDRPAPQK